MGLVRWGGSISGQLTCVLSGSNSEEGPETTGTTGEVDGAARGMR